MNVYTYYMEVPRLWPDDTQRALIALWEKSWRKHGWNPIVLHEHHAQKHPRYEIFKKKFWEFPTPFGHDYEGGCFMRWVAMDVMGGGLMTDYDVMNYGYPPRAVNPHTMIMISDKSEAPWCGAILAPKKLFARMSQIFLDWKHEDGDWLPEYNLFHCEDQIFLRHMLYEKKRQCPNWLYWEGGMTMFPKVTGKLVHYTSHAMKTAGRWPKHEHIEAIRPI